MKQLILNVKAVIFAKNLNKFNMYFKIALFSIFFSCMSLAQTKGTISGTITDKEAKNSPLPFANVVVKNTAIAVTTNENGVFTINIEPGNYTLQLSFIGYENLDVPVIVKAGETTTINKALGAGNYTLQDVVVKAATKNREKESALLLEQKKAVEIKQSIGAQEMARKGVSNVESGLTKITGISKVDGRGLFVRGLEDRYNNLLINDLQAPSNSPFKKIIPLDLFPTDIVGVLSVYKTFNPNISGDFAGATINIETAQPRTSITKMSVGYGYTIGNNGETFLLSEDANTTQGFLGLIGKDRELPRAFGSKPSAVKQSPNEYNESSKNNSWNVDESSSPINSSIGFLHGDKIKLSNEKSFVYLFSLNGDNKYQIQKGVDRTFNVSQGNYDNNNATTKYNYTTSLSGLASLKFKSKRFGIGFNTFLLKSTSSIIQDQLGFTNSLAGKDILLRVNQFEESRYWNSQILANYDLTENGNHSIKGGFSYVKTSFGQPDRKFITGEQLPNNEIKSSVGGNNLIRQFLDVSGDRFFSSMFEYNMKFTEKENGKSNKLSIGYNGFSNEEVSSYRFIFGRSITALSYTVNPNEINNNIKNDVNNGLLVFQEQTNGDYKSKLYQNINSGYVNSFFNFGEKIEINGGFRLENSLREIKYKGTFATTDDKFKKYRTLKLDILPSINFKYILNDKNNLRFAGSKTVTRPTSIEVLPIEYVNPDGTIEQGNLRLAKTKDLTEDKIESIKNSDNINVDFKYELFPNSKEMFAVGVFAKQITNPIERILIQSASSGGQITTYDNSKQAQIFGAEFELLFQLSRISPMLNNFSVGFNTSLMKTEVTVDKINNEIENSDKRALQGASDWLINSDIKYDFKFNKEMTNSISIVYGVAGEKIYAVGTNGLDHVYEKPFHKLDFVWSSRLSKNIDAKLAIDNILNPSFKRVLGDNSTTQIFESDLTVREFKRGTGVSLNLSYIF